MTSIRESLLDVLQKFSPQWIAKNQSLLRLNALSDSQAEVLTRVISREFSGNESFSERDALINDFYSMDQGLKSMISEILASVIPIQSILENKKSGLFERNSEAEAIEVQLLEKNGYQLSRNALNTSQIDEIKIGIKDVSFSNRGIFHVEMSGGEILRRIEDGSISKFNGANGDTFWIKDIDDLVANESLKKIAFDPYILRIASDYLGCCPIHVQTNLWFSFPTFSEKNNLSTNAQMFHQDKEFVKFLKVFIYLTDVDNENGPHVYIEGSHLDEAHLKGVPFSERISDDLVANYYDPTRIKVLLGKAGDIVFGDTSCVHKGMPLKTGYRIMLQFEYASSLYLSPVKPFKDLEAESLSSFGLSPSILKKVTQNYSTDRLALFESLESNQVLSEPSFLIKLMRLLKRYILRENIS